MTRLPCEFTYDERIDMIREAQEHLFQAIEILEKATAGDGNAKAYLVDHLKIMASEDHGFLSRDLNLDKLIERYREYAEEVEGEDGGNYDDEPDPTLRDTKPHEWN